MTRPDPIPAAGPGSPDDVCSRVRMRVWRIAAGVGSLHVLDTGAPAVRLTPTGQPRSPAAPATAEEWTMPEI